MKKPIYLGWAHSKDEPNFGDELSPYIIRKLTNREVHYIPALSNRIHLLLLILKRIVTLNITEARHYTSVLLGSNFYLCVGSILQFYRIDGGIVWGSGLIDKHAKTGNHKYYAVRGPITRKIITERGFTVPPIVGDPAILLRRLYDIPQKVTHEIGLIPHVVHFDSISSRLKNNDILVIDLRTKNVEGVIDRIRSCKFVASSSLHGIIVAHAYGVPALWMNAGKPTLIGDNVKFADYFESVGIPHYTPIEFEKIVSQEFLEANFSAFREHSLPQVDLSTMGEKLLENSPFTRAKRL